MLTVHHLGISQSDRIVWLCEELGLEYNLDKHDRDPETGGGPASYKALSPFGTAPVITDGDLVLGESGAIIEYLIHRYGNGKLSVAPGQPNYPDYLYWFHFANASLMSAGMVELAMRFAGLEEAPIADRLRWRGDRAFAVVNERLAQTPYFAGDEFTAADIIMMFPLTTMRMFAPRDITPFPHLRAYLQKIVQRDAFKRALAKADPDLQPKID
ncbi:glutathione S-transferase family protein [Croceicoccus bisphenolivorans]|uniref:glutathione S-transferase family protein n=1 Tax=Croceicoccus bisphenolivorans TaxID=1783232 RepID=UPI000834889E|nr:glutathione S-transferase family protein [Croceicoccus bisphenolivorans]